MLLNGKGGPKMWKSFSPKVKFKDVVRIMVGADIHKEEVRSYSGR